MARAQIEIGKRAFEEVLRISPSMKAGRRHLGINSQQLLYDWANGSAPSAKYLQRLYFLGADVLYILTGRRGLYELPEVQQSEHKGCGHLKWTSE